MACDFFGTDDDIAHGDALTRAWALRQRDTKQALALLDALPADLAAPIRGRAELVRAEAAWLFNRLSDAAAHLAAARAAFAAAADEAGLGDADLLDAALCDQAGGDRDAAMRAAHEHYRRAGDATRERIAATWSACVEATANADDAQAHWGAVLDAAAALGKPGLTTYVEAARATLAWRRGDIGAAIGAYQRGYDAALIAGLRHAAVTLALNTGIAFSTLNDHEGALAWAERARTLVQPTGWPYLTAWCLMQTGSILLGLGRAQAARQLLLEGLPVFQGCQGSRNHVLAQQVLGEACLEVGEDADALRWCEAALAGARRLPFPDLVSGSLRYLALARARQGQVQAAQAAAQEALDVAQAQDDWPRVATVQHVLAEIARRHGLPPPAGSEAPSGAIHHLQAALAAGARMPGYQPPAQWLQELSADFEAAGDLPRALQREREASDARRHAERRRADDHATAMLVRHRIEQAQAEAERQRAIAQTQQLRAELLQTQAALEKERTQALLVHAGKMVAIGRMASGVVHEMSHPVGSLLLLAEALAERLERDAHAAPAEVTATLATLVAEARRLHQFVSRLRDFARAEPPQLARLDMRAVLADARHLFAPRLALLRVVHDEEVPSVMVDVDPQRLALALANLVFNAADAMAGSPQRRLRVHGERAGDEVFLHVDDSGPGVPEDVLPHLFEPFFTTKPAGQGLGLGLALSAESLAAMRGRIVVANRAEGGARFSIVLPAAA
ncbi:ATP-binding protein [Piscinibacter sp.]|jgi:signal transduction histidine kinase|uniref:ATP-binding protein n=1 Tax=Piscinibacter sp. TaxID=1903157 RepID=UPI001D4AF302|nr:ATP-binding protein [Piscinibacter sp.]MBK7531936.1 hypothetical protein [Piscinibacter sp.]